MRIVGNLAAYAVALTLVASLAGCQFGGQALDQDRRQELSEDQPTSESSSAVAEGIEATVLRVVDGDTIAVRPDAAFPATNDAGTEHLIRMLGIDTPEMNRMSDKAPKCGAQEASDHLAALLAAGDTGVVSVVFDSRADRTDRFGRSLAYVQLPGGSDIVSTDLALSMAVDGYAAAWYPQGEPEPERFPAYASAQQAAEANGSGLYATCDTIGR